MSKKFEFAVIRAGLIATVAKSSDYIGKISSDLVLVNKWDSKVDKRFLSLNFSI